MSQCHPTNDRSETPAETYLPLDWSFDGYKHSCGVHPPIVVGPLYALQPRGWPSRRVVALIHTNPVKDQNSNRLGNPGVTVTHDVLKLGPAGTSNC